MGNQSEAVCGPLPPLRRGVDVPRCNGSVDFERLYKMYSRRVHALCFRISRNTEEAEDLTQEAFLQVFRKIDTFRGESAFATWLYRLVLNVALMRLRKKRPPEFPLEADAGPGQESAPARHLYDAPDAALTGAIDRVQLERAIAGLAPGYKVVFLLHDVEGYDHPEIAEILGWAPGTSKSQLHKARLKLRDLLSGTLPAEAKSTDVRPLQNHPRAGTGRQRTPDEMLIGPQMRGWLYAPWRRKKIRPSRPVATKALEPAALQLGTQERRRSDIRRTAASARVALDSTVNMRLEKATQAAFNDLHRSHASL